MKTIMVGLSVCAGLCAQNSDPAKQMAEQKQTAVMQFVGGGPQMGPIGVQTAMAGSTSPVAGAPYSAEAVTERVQTLADGNRIVQTTSGTVVRDSRGRVRRDESLALALPGSKGDAPKFEMIDDPVAGVHWRLDPQTKTAIKMTFPKLPPSLPNKSFPPPPGAEGTWFFSSGAPGSQITIETLAKRKAEADTNVNELDLGTQTVEGVPAQGKRITRTIPAGEVGNEQPLVITTETWYSPALKVLVVSKAEDPRMGVTTYRLTNIQRAEPPASLFEIPADYAVKDQPTNRFFYRETKKIQ
jgi:hypothetical protein